MLHEYLRHHPQIRGLNQLLLESVISSTIDVCSSSEYPAYDMKCCSFRSFILGEFVWVCEHFDVFSAILKYQDMLCLRTEQLNKIMIDVSV